MSEQPPTKKEIAIECERCINDPVYFYNTYFLVNGKNPNPITQEQWDEFTKMSEEYQRNRFKRRRLCYR